MNMTKEMLLDYINEQMAVEGKEFYIVFTGSKGLKRMVIRLCWKIASFLETKKWPS